MGFSHAGEHYQAVLLDVDGTLYELRRMQLHVAAELARLPFELRSLPRARRAWRGLKAFRSAREELRGLGRPEASLEELQYAEPARRLGEDPVWLREVTSQWIHQRPLKYLRRCRRPGLGAFLELMGRQSVRVGAFSDYPCTDKLVALEVRPHFSLLVSAIDPEVNAFKPHPQGFLRACEQWALAPEDVLYIGDRPSVDGAGASAAGMPHVIVGRASQGSNSGVKGSGQNYVCFRELLKAVAADDAS